MAEYRIVELDSGFYIETEVEVSITVKAKTWFGTVSIPSTKKEWRRLDRFGCGQSRVSRFSWLIIPPLPPFKTLKSAREYLQKKRNPKYKIHNP